MKSDEYLYLWAQWGILNFEQYQFVLKKFGNLKTAWKKITPSFLENSGIGSKKVRRIFEIREKISFHDMMSIMKKLDIKILSVSDEDYPSGLAAIHDPPPFLFIRGKLPSFHKSIGIVGTRSMTDYGFSAAEKFTTDLVYNGFVIVSGLALGVDACAHKTTIKNNGITVAVLGSGVDSIYPSSNSFLANSIIKSGGAVISEYPLFTSAAKHHFPARNRIISGLSRGVLIVEGGIRSGALITAKLALEQGREVFAVPNNITKTALSGTNFLIRRGEAKLVESVKHILEEFQMEAKQEQMSFNFNDTEKDILGLLSSGGKTIDELLIETSISVSKINEILIRLNLKNAIRESGCKWVLS